MNEEQLRQRLEELFPNEAIEGEGFETIQKLHEKHGDVVIEVVDRLHKVGDIPSFGSILILKNGYATESWMTFLEDDLNEILYHRWRTIFGALKSADNLDKHPDAANGIA